MALRQQTLLNEIESDVKFLRRYARALTGSQPTGDRYALVSLEVVLEDPEVLNRATSPRIGLFGVLHSVWESSGERLSEPDTPLVIRAEHHMARLTPRSREAVLLRSIEGFKIAEIAEILSVPVAEVHTLLTAAEREMMQSVAGSILIIEDDPVIALDLEGIVTAMGHAVTGIARTRTEAVALAQRQRPDLVLADVQLADRSSGIDAVNEILGRFARTPVIFITGHPEKLLTGAGPEPAFLIAKPFGEDQVRSAVSQAMFFASTETLQQ